MILKKFLLILGVSLIFICSIGFMNYNYDKLSRYPYKDVESRKLIKKYLNDEEIEYIIEYSIAPSLFKEYIMYDGFNIYNASNYFKLGQLQWSYSKSDIVKIVEETKDIYDIETINQLLNHYKYEEINHWLKFKDKYNEKSNLVFNAGYVDALVDDNNTVGIRVPFNLQDISTDIPTLRKDIKIDIALQEPLKKLCDAIKEETNSSKRCGGLYISSGYISYDEQKDLYEAAIVKYGDKANYYEFYPGHSEHQLGLAIDFTLKNSKLFSESEQSNWLKENAYRFGFIQTYNEEGSKVYNKEEKDYHYRYVGYSLAYRIHSENTTLKDIK